MTLVKKQPKISLVGAGPGDPDLLTIKGLKAIQSADVILYDALANTALLEEAPEQTIKIYVGKRANNHRYKQEEIHLLLVQYAFSHGHVVRLKGGDPFVFGRGHEELEYARHFDIPVEIVPGISSCISVPAGQQVPVTRRGVNESFWVLTATTKSGALSKDIEVAVQSSATVVILMGIRKLPQIADLFLQAGKQDLPVMVIQNGSLPNEKLVIGEMATITEQVQQAQIGSPGIIVIGDVVNLHPSRLQTIATNKTASV